MEKNRPVTIVVGGMTAVGIVAGCLICVSVMPNQPLLVTLLTLAVILAGNYIFIAGFFL